MLAKNTNLVEEEGPKNLGLTATSGCKRLMFIPTEEICTYKVVHYMLIKTAYTSMGLD